MSEKHTPLVKNKKISKNLLAIALKSDLPLMEVQRIYSKFSDRIYRQNFGHLPKYALKYLPQKISKSELENKTLNLTEKYFNIQRIRKAKRYGKRLNSFDAISEMSVRNELSPVIVAGVYFGFYLRNLIHDRSFRGIKGNTFLLAESYLDNKRIDYLNKQRFKDKS